MGDALDLLRGKVQKMMDVITPTIRDSIESNADEIVKIQTDNQLEEGEDSNGDKIEPPYTEFTKSLKMLKGQPFNKVTWKDTGALYDSLKVKARDKEFEIDAHVPYIDDLEKKYGEQVLGLQDELLADFVENYIVQDIKKEYEQIAKS